MEGTPVYTHLERTSQPMIRLASNDRTRWINAPCPCGRTYPRLPDGIYGRYDDVFIIRGNNLYPGAIEDALRGVEGFGGEFQVIISRQDTMDELLIRAEYIPVESDEDSVNALQTVMLEKIRGRLGLRPILELVPQGTLPRTEFKARRVIDDRDVYRTSLAKQNDR
jgi:phenylacetate-CoA ligase